MVDRKAIQSKVETLLGGCTCITAFSMRNLIDPSCAYHEFADDVVAEMEVLQAAIWELQRAGLDVIDAIDGPPEKLHAAALDLHAIIVGAPRWTPTPEEPDKE